MTDARRPKGPVAAKGSPSAIERAVEASRAKQQAVVLAELSIRVAEQPIVVQESGDLAITRGEQADPSQAAMLVWDAKINAFRAVLMPPGTSWELVARRQGPALWKPGMPA